MGKLGKTIKWLCIGGLVAGSAGATYKWGPQFYSKWAAGSRQENKADAVRFTAARRGEMKIVITEDGKLRAIKNHPVYPQLRGQQRIAWLIAEGTAVKKGDKLVEFEKKPLEESLQTKAGELETAKRQLTVAEEGLTIQYATSRAAVAGAKTKLEEAEVALKVYENLEGPKKINELEGSINEARTKYNQALKTLDEVQRKLDDQLFNEDKEKAALEKELMLAKETLASTKKIVDTHILQQKIFRRYDYPQSVKTKTQAVKNAILEHEKAKVAERSEVSQKTAERDKVRDQITRLNREIERLNEDIKKSTLTAPVDGMVLYGDPTNPWRYYGEGQIRVGMDWYGSNVLMTIPDTSAFEVAISVGEEYRGKLQPGNKALITVEAIPGLTIDGELKKIENLARNRVQWDQASPKVFDCVVNPAKSDPRMLSGMTTRVEIVAEVIPDTLTVPLEAVYNEDGTPVVYVKKDQGSERRIVKPGKSNDHQVEILDGLKEGEMVDMTPSRSSGVPLVKPDKPEEKKAEEKPATPAAPPPQASAQ